MLADLPVAELAAMNSSQAEHEADATIARLSRATSRRNAARNLRLARQRTRDDTNALGRGPARRTRDRQRRFSRSRRTATAIAAGRSTDWAAPTFSSPSSKPRFAIGAPTTPSTRAKICRASCPATCGSPRFRRARIRATLFAASDIRHFESLPAGARVGTSSPRRRLQLAALRPELRYEDLRGNIDTRLRKLRDGAYDAIVLAMAGLERLEYAPPTPSRSRSMRSYRPSDKGAFAIETRADDDRLATELRAAVNDPRQRAVRSCERSALRALRAGCSAPIGIHAFLEDGVMVATGVHVLGDGTILRNAIARPIDDLDEAEAMGIRARPWFDARPAGWSCWLAPASGPSRIAEALRADGVEVIELRAGDDGPDPAERTPDMLLFPSSGAVTAAEPYLARLRRSDRRPLVAAMGAESRRAAGAAGFEPDAVSDEPSIDAFVRLVRERLSTCP